MLPLKDMNPSRGIPLVNYCIIGVCVLVFLYELQLGSRIEEFMRTYGLIPVRYTRPVIAAHFSLGEQILPFFSSMFLHGGWFHLFGNLWVLYIFGDNVEGEMGHARYGAFYVISGLIAAVIQVLFNPSSSIPTVGASGAIAGIMGAYFMLYPGAKILTFIPVFFIPYLIVVPAYVFLGFWFIMQFFSGTFSLLGGGNHVAGVAWWAHVGGFVGGALLLNLFKETSRYR